MGRQGRWWRRALTALAAVAAVACGGGGSSSGDGPFLPTPSEAAEGLYNAVTLTNRVVRWLLLGDGRYFIFYTAPGRPDDWAGVIQGTATTAGGTLRSSDARDYSLEQRRSGNANVSGSVDGRRGIHAEVGFADGSRTTLSGSFDPGSEGSADLPNLAGTYVGVAASLDRSQAGALNVNAAGELAGVWFGCVLTGRASPRSRTRSFDLTLDFSNVVSCPYGGQRLNGVAYLDAGAHRLYVAAPNAARSDLVLFVGQ